MKKILIITFNTFNETIRQPVFMITLAAGAFMIGSSPSYAMFTLMEDMKLVKDMGLATMLITGLLQAIFSAVRVVSHEIENKTILTVLTKPVSKTEVIFGKFGGIALALVLSMYMLNIFLVMAVRVGVPEAVYSPIHRPLVYGQFAALAIALLMAAFSNYFYDRPFGSSVFINSIATFSLVFLVFGFFDSGMKIQGFLADVDMQVLGAGYLVCISVLCAGAIAVAFATRLGPVFTTGFCLSIFIIGLLSDHLFGRFAGENIFARAAYSAVPNMQVFWVADALSEGIKVPLEYLTTVTLYGIILCLWGLFLGVLLFEQKEN